MLQILAVGLGKFTIQRTVSGKTPESVAEGQCTALFSSFRNSTVTVNRNQSFLVFDASGYRIQHIGIEGIRNGDAAVYLPAVLHAVAHLGPPALRRVRIVRFLPLQLHSGPGNRKNRRDICQLHILQHMCLIPCRFFRILFHRIIEAVVIVNV